MIEVIWSKRYSDLNTEEPITFKMQPLRTQAPNTFPPFSIEHQILAKRKRTRELFFNFVQNLLVENSLQVRNNEKTHFYFGKRKKHL